MEQMLSDILFGSLLPEKLTCTLGLPPLENFEVRGGKRIDIKGMKKPELP